MEHKRVYVLGAGSSIGHSGNAFPGIKDFFEKAEELNIPEFEILNTSVSKLMGIDLLKQANNLNIEKLATLIEIEIERNPKAEILAVRESLLNLIQKVLTKATKHIQGKDGEFNLLKKMLKNSDTILTFNWDLLLDSVLGRTEILTEWYNERGDRKTKGLYYNFIFHISPLGEATYARASCSVPYEERKSDTGYLLKLHGSIDWFYCANENCRAYSKVFPRLVINKSPYCGECHEPLLRLLIPPILNKAYRQYPLIRKIWNLAIREISIADEIVIWGYSLPPTDFYAYWLLTNASQDCQKIVLINPRVIKTGKAGKQRNFPFIKPFKEAFSGVSENRNKFELFEDFKDYHDKCDIYKKHGIRKSLRK